jgi:putative NADPH-quinone reductase
MRQPKAGAMLSGNTMNILVMNGHPSGDSLVGALAEDDTAGARDNSHAVEVLRLSELRFEPDMSYQHGSANLVVTPELNAQR